MKNTIFKSILTLIMFTALFSCSSDSDSNTPAPVTKTKVGVTKIEVNLIPPNDGGIAWDIGSNPDLYIQIHDHTTTTPQLTTNTVWDIDLTPTNVFTCIMPTNQTDDLNNATMTIQVYDDDSDIPNTNDYVGEVMFRISDYTSGSNKYPPLVYKVVNGTMVSMYLTWE